MLTAFVSKISVNVTVHLFLLPVLILLIFTCNYYSEGIIASGAADDAICLFEENQDGLVCLYFFVILLACSFVKIGLVHIRLSKSTHRVSFVLTRLIRKYSSNTMPYSSCTLCFPPLLAW